VRSRKERPLDLVGTASAGPPAAAIAVERLRLERLVTDAVTGLPLHPLTDLERVAGIGIVYLQLGRFAGVESLYGWSSTTASFRLTTASLREDLEASPLKGKPARLHFNGCDGFYLLFRLSMRPAPRHAALLEPEARRLRTAL